MEHNYRWEAEQGDGTIIKTGGDLTGCARFSLIPQNINLPQHDLVGIALKRRFDRTIAKNVLGTNKQIIVLHCIVAEGFRLYINDSTGSVLTTPEDYELYL